MSSRTVDLLLELQRSAGKAYQANEPGAREALIDVSAALIASLELPSEFLQRSLWAEPAKSAIVRMAVDLKLFQHLKEAGKEGINAEELARKTESGIDLSLLERFLRHLAAMHLAAYEEGRWKGTKLTNELAAANYQDSICFCYDVARPSFNQFPEHFKKVGYQPPTNSGVDGPFQTAHQTNLPFFPWLQANPPNLQHFASFMASYRAGKANWYDPGFYPVQERLLDDFDSSISRVLMVDQGGSKGHDLIEFNSRHSSHPGQLILQDLPDVVNSIVGDKSTLPFQATAHDFFTQQPVHGARAYFMHSILHDWSDDAGVSILENLKPALRPGYSLLLLNEIVVNEERPALPATVMDQMMLAHLNVKERTEREWTALLNKTGYKINKIYTFSGVAESLIEAELA